MANDPSSSDTDTTNQRRMTTDTERIREWAEARDAVPVRMRDSDDHGHTFARRDELGEHHEEYDWDEFDERFQNEDLVFVYHEDEPMGDEMGFFEIVEREEAFDRADLGRDELEESLRQGETVTTEIVETQVVEREIVERDTIESEVVDTELVEREIVDSELLTHDAVEMDFVDENEEMVEVIIDETRLDTIEEIERYIVESRVVDVDIEQDEELESDEIETDIELENVQRSILESDVVRSDVAPDDVVEQEVIQSQRTEGDTVQSELIERRTVEEELSERRRLEYLLEESELVESDVVASDVIEGEIIDVDEYGAGGTAGMETETAEMETETTETTEIETETTETAEMETETTETAEMETETAGTAGGGTSMAADDDPTGLDTERDEPMAGSEADSGMATDEASEPATIELSQSEQGKDVVDETGQQIGMIAEVEGQTAYVDPEPGLTDRLRARLDWGGHGDDDYPVDSSEIKEITDDEVVIHSE